MLSSRKQHPTPVFLPGEFLGQKSLADCSPWGRKETDMTEATEHTHTYTHCPVEWGVHVLNCLAKTHVINRVGTWVSHYNSLCYLEECTQVRMHSQIRTGQKVIGAWWGNNAEDISRRHDTLLLLPWSKSSLRDLIVPLTQKASNTYSFPYVSQCFPKA